MSNRKSQMQRRNVFATHTQMELVELAIKMFGDGILADEEKYRIPLIRLNTDVQVLIRSINKLMRSPGNLEYKRADLRPDLDLLATCISRAGVVNDRYFKRDQSTPLDVNLLQRYYDAVKHFCETDGDNGDAIRALALEYVPVEETLSKLRADFGDQRDMTARWMAERFEALEKEGYRTAREQGEELLKRLKTTNGPVEKDAKERLSATIDIARYVRNLKYAKKS